MTERIDHAAEARRGLSVLTGDDAPDDLPVIETLSAAQVHATLALVEQQRIANLLALAQFAWEAEGVRLFTRKEFAVKMRAEAEEALGLEGDRDD